MKEKTNIDLVRDIIDTQIKKLHELSEKSKMPLNAQDIRTLTELSKLISESENLNRQTKNTTDEFTADELLLIYEYRKNKPQAVRTKGEEK